jgi:hypothetical protein
MSDLWTFADEAIGDIDLVGFLAAAVDGPLGRVDEASGDIGSCCVIIETGRFFGKKKVIVPAGMIKDIDLESKTVYVAVTKEEVKQAPDYEPIGLKLDEYKSGVARHYLRTNSHLSS